MEGRRSKAWDGWMRDEERREGSGFPLFGPNRQADQSERASSKMSRRRRAARPAFVLAREREERIDPAHFTQGHTHSMKKKSGSIPNSLQGDSGCLTVGLG